MLRIEHLSDDGQAFGRVDRCPVHNLHWHPLFTFIKHEPLNKPRCEGRDDHSNPSLISLTRRLSVHLFATSLCQGQERIIAHRD